MFNKKYCMITVDYYSDYFEIDQLYCTTSSAIVKNLKSHFARNGIPDKVTNLRNFLNHGIFYIQPLYHTTVALMVKLKLL